MRRRHFLGTAAAATAMAAFPGWLRRAFADTSGVPGGAHGGADLAQASERARRLGKPLLILIIPADDNLKDARGNALGAWLNFGDQADMAPLALCEVVCAPLSELRRVTSPSGACPPFACRKAGEPLMVMVDELGATPLDGQLPADNWGDPKQEDAIVDRRIAILSRLVKQAVMGDGALARRVERARAMLPVDERSALEALLARGGLPTVAQADRGAARVALAAARAPRLEKILADAATARLRTSAPAGSHWAHSANCIGDPEVEGMDDVGEARMVGCGMGHSPVKSGRFLYLWAKPPRRREREARAASAKP